MPIEQCCRKKRSDIAVRAGNYVISGSKICDVKRRNKKSAGSEKDATSIMIK